MSGEVRPAVSVLMGVHNGMPWLREAVESVLAQTAGDLELIVVDDGSIDATPTWLQAVRDPRLHTERQARAGLACALNRGLRLARAPLVARLDADDVARPDRLQRQRRYLDAHPEVGLLGSGAREVDSGGHEVRVVQPPRDDRAIRRALIRRNPFVHSSVILRRVVLEQVGGYDESLPAGQDYDLWMRASRVTCMANLDEPLVVRRLVPGRVSVTRDSDRLRTEMRVRWRAVRSGAYPAWCVIFALRPALALLLPPRVRRVARVLWRQGRRSIAMTSERLE